MMEKIEVIGLMSGTSMDGLDVAHVSFSHEKDQSDKFELLHQMTFTYPEEIMQKLMHSGSMSVSEICLLDKDLGKFYADCVNNFTVKFKIKKEEIQLIASHGQTILHQPHLGYTLQIGCGQTLAFHTGISVINDFRSLDVIAGGQGAPLVPVGDFGLFHEHAEAFLNIGGFCNVSWKENGIVRAFDICPGNLPLNALAQHKGLSYDKNGKIAESGTINFFLLDLLNNLPYYTEDGPKSLGTEWLESDFYPLIKMDKEIENNMATLVEHIAIQISNQLNNKEIASVLITGGGAKNQFLIERIQHYYNGHIILPSDDIIDYKEAIIFAYLGYLRLLNRENTLASVTGAASNLSSGVLHTSMR